MAKRYYWLKLPDGFFRQKAIKKLRKIAGGDTYTIIYLKMLLVAMKQDGRLYFEGVEATFYDELALDLDEEVENVRVTVMFLIQQDLMQLIDETEYSLSECAKMTGSESTSAARVRKYRSKEALQCNTDVTGCNEVKQICNVEKEIESILRNAYRSWYFKRRIQEIEAIGIERDLAGLPVIHAPENLEIWDSQDPDMVKINGALITMVKNLRRNESEGLVLPHGYEAELLSTGGTRQFDTNAIIAF